MWVEARSEEDWVRLVPLALLAIDHIAYGSELADLWAESGDLGWVGAPRSLTTHMPSRLLASSWTRRRVDLGEGLAA